MKGKSGDINGSCEIYKTTQNVLILGAEFTKTTDFDISIDDKIISYSKAIKFNSIGKKNVKFIIYEDLKMDNMFKDVSSLYSINMTSENNAKILSMKGTFENTQYLNEFYINGFDTSEITSLNRLFYKSSISKINMSNFKTTNLKDISYMFSSTRLSSLDFSYFNTSSIEDMSSLFEGCKILNRINFNSSYFITKQVKNFSNMFRGCDSLNELDLSNLDTSQAVNMSKMFQGCYKQS